MRRFLLCLFAGTILATLAVYAAVSSTPFAEGVLRPWAETKAAALLAGKVHLDHLEFGWGRLELHGLRIERPGELHLAIERVTVRYTPTGLWRRRLEAVALHQPDLEWRASGKDAKEPAPWPEQPPLQVGTWAVTAGRVLLDINQEQLLLRQIEATGSLGASYQVEVAAELGPEPGVAVAASGHGRWDGPPELTLTHLLWAEHSLLQTPVTIVPGAKTLEASISLARLDDTAVGQLLTALGRHSPWPPEISWEVTAPRLMVGIDGHRVALRLETGPGTLRRGEQRWPWEGLNLQLAKTPAGWAIDAQAALPARARLQWTGAWSEQAVHGHGQLVIPSPARLGHAFGLASPPAMDTLEEMTLSGELRAAAGGITATGLRLAARWHGRGELAGTFDGRWHEGSLAIETDNLTAAEAGIPLATAQLALSGRPAEQRWQGRWQTEIADVGRLAALLAALLAGPAPASLPTLRELTLQGEITSTGELLNIPLTIVDSHLEGTGLSGRLTGRLTIRRQPAGWRCNIEQLAATAIEYTSADGLSGLTAGTLRLGGELAWHDDLTFALAGEATAGEALAGRWYADLSGLPLRWAADGHWAPATGRTRLQTGQLDLAGVLAARLHGELSRQQLALNGELTIPRLDGAFEERLKQLAGGMLPALDRLTLTGGLTAALAGGWQPSGWSLQATVRPLELSATWGEQFRLGGLDGEVPLLLRRGPTPAPTGRQTTLAWTELRLGPLLSAGGRTRLTAGVNSLQLEDPLRLTAGGGQLLLGEITLQLPAEGVVASAGLKATDIELAQLSRAFGWPEMGGKLGAELPEIRITGETIGIGGEARLQVFDGELRLRNMQAEKPFSRHPIYHADLDFTGLDLQLLTQAFAFGEINGIADGSLHDLRLFGTVPTAFRATFETREQGPRNISVKALRNLNTLSQGGISAVLSQGVYRFIDYYRYRKIGIRCRLQNDLFYLEGTAKPGTTTALIDGGWRLPRIDIIVSSPTISFQEMVKRLKRIERTGH